MRRSRTRLPLIAALFLPLAACTATPRNPELASPEPVFDPAAFFKGPTRGIGSLDVIFSKDKKTDVVGMGHVAPDGTLVLVQQVSIGGKPPKQRTWRVHAAGDQHYSGTLTDAEGPVSGDVQGNRLHLHFKAKGGYAVEQWLYLQPGGKVALNRMAVHKFGLPVASLDETIRKVRSTRAK